MVVPSRNFREVKISKYEVGFNFQFEIPFFQGVVVHETYAEKFVYAKLYRINLPVEY